MYICFLPLSILFSLHQRELQILLSKGKLLWKYYPWKYSMESSLLSSIQCIHPCVFLWKYVLDTYWILENFQVENFRSTFNNIFWSPAIRFRQKQDKNVSGISNSSRVKRRNRNLVTMKFHMFNWILETLSTILVLILTKPNRMRLQYSPSKVIISTWKFSSIQ